MANKHVSIFSQSEIVKILKELNYFWLRKFCTFCICIKNIAIKRHVDSLNLREFHYNMFS